MYDIQLDLFDPATLAVFATLAMLSFVALTVAFYKVIQFARLGVGRRKKAEQILDTWLSGRAEEAMQMAAARKSVLARLSRLLRASSASRSQTARTRPRALSSAYPT